MRVLPLLVALAGVLLSQDQPLPDGVSLAIVVQEVQGEVDVRTPAQEGWVPARAGMRIPVGSKLCTGVESGAVVSFGTNSVAIVSACSICEIRTFEMRGEELVARVHIEPGIAKVNVKQLAQFHTDFQVSTPRLTCSVRGSEMVVESNGDEKRDRAECTNDQAFMTDASGDEHELDEEEESNDEGDSNMDIASEENAVDVVEGDTEYEDEVSEENAAGIDLNWSDANVDVDSSPEGSDGGDDDLFESETPREIREAIDLLAAHGYGELLDFLQYGPDSSGERMTAAQDQWDDVNFNLNTDPIYVDKRNAILVLDEFFPFGGILHDHRGLDWPQEHALLHAFLEENHLEDHAFDGSEGEEYRAALHELAHEQGLDVTIDQALADMSAGFDDDLASMTNLTQAERDLRENDFYNAPDVGFNSMVNDLGTLAEQAANGAFDNNLYGKTLVELLHARTSQELIWLPPGSSPGQYGYEYPSFRQDVVDDLLTILQEEGIHAMIDAKAERLHDYWHGETGVPENVQPGQPGYEEHEELHGAMSAFQDKAHFAADNAGDAGGDGR